MKRCDHCLKSRFGLVRYYEWGRVFCSQACKTQWWEDRMREVRVLRFLQFLGKA